MINRSDRNPTDFQPWDAFMKRLEELTNGSVTVWVNEPWSDIAAVAWLFVSMMAGIAVFYHSVRDTVLERIALAAISMGALSRAFFIFARGEVPMDGVWVSCALAFYCAVVWWKHFYVIPRRPDYKPPQEMPPY